MPRPLKRKKLPDPVDIIDLTQDSPTNVSFRQARTRSEAINCEVIPVCFVSDIENNGNERQSNRTRLNKQPTAIINLDETVILDDSTSKGAKVQSPVLSNSPKSKPLNCPICLENLSDDKIKAMTTPCGHVFCYDCLKIISQSKKKCSLCQRPITFSKCIRLHI